MLEEGRKIVCDGSLFFYLLLLFPLKMQVTLLFLSWLFLLLLKHQQSGIIGLEDKFFAALLSNN